MKRIALPSAVSHALSNGTLGWMIPCVSSKKIALLSILPDSYSIKMKYRLRVSLQLGSKWREYLFLLQFLMLSRMVPYNQWFHVFRVKKKALLSILPDSCSVKMKYRLRDSLQLASKWRECLFLVQFLMLYRMVSYNQWFHVFRVKNSTFDNIAWFM